MRVLVACEFSGIVREAFKRHGHDAWSCDLLTTEIPGNHIQDDVLLHLDDGWDLMIAHPPCTYLSNAGARHLYKNKELNQERYDLGIEAKGFFISLLNAPIIKIAIENPTPNGIFHLPKESQVINPFEFGVPIRKRTLLWLKNLPPLISTLICINRESTRVPGNWFNAKGKERQRNRQKTSYGIAEAMANQWS
jgi:hypothetical protein